MPYLISVTTQALKDNSGLTNDQATFQKKIAAEAQKSITTDGTSYALYKAIADTILKNAATTSFVNKELQYLQIVTSGGTASVKNKTIVLALTASTAMVDNDALTGETYFKTRIVARKKAALLAYFNYLADPASIADIDLLYGGGNSPYKPQQNSQPRALTDVYAGYFKAAQDLCNAKPSASLDDDIAALDKALKAPLANLPGLYTTILQAVTAKQMSKFTTVSGRALMAVILKILNSKSFVVASLINLLVDQFRINCLRSTAARASNAERAKSILTELGGTGIANVDMKPTLGAGHFATALGLIKQRLTDLAAKSAVNASHLDSLLYSDPQTIAIPALQQLMATTLALAGLGSLQEATNLSFEPAIISNALVVELASTINTLLSSLLISLAWKVPPGTFGAGTETAIPAMAALKPLVFYDLDGYVSAVGKLKYPFLTMDDINAQKYSTPLNSIDVPLSDIVGSTILFYNCNDFLYLNDTVKPDTFYAVNQAVATSLFSMADASNATDPNAARKTIIAACKRPNLDLSFRRTYVALYLVTPAAVQTHIMWVKASGLGDGIGRADKAETYRWTFTGSVERIAAALKIPVTMKSKLKPFDVTVIGAFIGLDSALLRADGVNGVQTETSTSSNGLSYAFLVEPGSTNTTDNLNFVRCNSPYPITARTFGYQPPTLDLEDLQFGYYRQTGFGSGALASGKVLKSVESKKNKPRLADVAKGCQSADAKTIGINLPICFNIKKNRDFFDTNKKTRGPIKNKGNFLTKNLNFRQDAGSVMGGIVPFVKQATGLSQTNLSANSLVTLIVPRRKARTDWQNLKLTTLMQLPTDQEWCHLQGHGDNGNERIGNFVSGSKHCNTEQLAIESAQRPTTTRPENAKTYMLKSTAYLVGDDSMEPVINNRTYLGLDGTYEENAYKKNPKAKAKTPENINKDANLVKTNAPVAAFIRYKIAAREVVTVPVGNNMSDNNMTDQKEVYKNVLSYVFEGQSEFFDANQYNILYYSVYFMINQTGFLQELTDFYLTNYVK